MPYVGRERERGRLGADVAVEFGWRREASSCPMVELEPRYRPANCSVSKRHHLVGHLGISKRLGADDAPCPTSTVHDDQRFVVINERSCASHELTARDADRTWNA